MRPLKNIGNSCCVDTIIQNLVLGGVESNSEIVAYCKNWMFSTEEMAFYPLKNCGDGSFKDYGDIVDNILKHFKNIYRISDDFIKINENLDKYYYLLVDVNFVKTIPKDKYLDLNYIIFDNGHYYTINKFYDRDNKIVEYIKYDDLKKEPVMIQQSEFDKFMKTTFETYDKNSRIVAVLYARMN
jgi:hypothetical protein